MTIIECTVSLLATQIEVSLEKWTGDLQPSFDIAYFNKVFAVYNLRARMDDDYIATIHCDLDFEGLSALYTQIASQLMYAVSILFNLESDYCLKLDVQ